MKELQKESGYLIVESSLIYPVVILCVLLLIFIGLFGLQSHLVFVQLNEVAQVGTDMVINSKYAELNEIEDAAGSVSRVRDYYKDSNPYRYFKFNYSTQEGELQEMLQTRLQNFCLLNTTRFATCKADIKNYVLAQSVEIEVEYSMELPRLFSLIGMNRTFTYKNSVTYQSIDPAEFVRNTDLVVDITQTLAKRFGIDGKINTFLQKMKDIKAKFS